MNKQISKVAHEMRTPLNAIISMLECLEKEIDVYLKGIYLMPCLNSARLLISLLNDILDFAQLRKNKLEMSLLSFNLKRLIEKTISIFEIQAKKRSIKIHHSYDNRIPYKIRSDQNRLRQIIINLLSNALKFTKTNGNIKISCTQQTDHSVRIGVKDDGVGIDKQQQQYLFQEFGKIINSETRKLNSQGVGLGLQISQELAVLLGAKSQTGLQIESSLGLGAEFFFFLKNYEAGNNNENLSESENSGTPNILTFKPPTIRNLIVNIENPLKDFQNLKPHSSNSLDKQLLKSQGSMNSFAIIAKGWMENGNPPFLIVDDNEFNVIALTCQLEQLGFQSEGCYSGTEAILKVKQKKQSNEFYQIIFMDVEMPGIDGRETTSQILTITKQSLIVGCTGYSQEIEKRKCYDSGMVDVIDKPVSQKLLKQLLKKLIKP